MSVTVSTLASTLQNFFYPAYSYLESYLSSLDTLRHHYRIVLSSENYGTGEHAKC